MGWGGASGLPAVVYVPLTFHLNHLPTKQLLRGIFFFTGPVLLLLSTIFCWIQGQFFPMMVCGLFCVFWLSFGMLQLPTLGLAEAYASGAGGKEMNAVIALYLLVWGFALGTFWLFTLRINAVFAGKKCCEGRARLRINSSLGIFGFVTIGSWVLSGAYWKVSTGHFDEAGRLQKVCWPLKARSGEEMLTSWDRRAALSCL